MIDDVTPGSALDILRKAASELAFEAAVESNRAAEEARKLRVIVLADRRPKPPPVGCSDDWRLIDRFCQDLMLVESVEIQIRAGLGGILVEALSNVEAIVAWRTISAEIKSPLRRQVIGEPVYQPMIDRLKAIDALATNFWTHHALRLGCPRYRPTEGEEI